MPALMPLVTRGARLSKYPRSLQLKGHNMPISRLEGWTLVVAVFVMTFCMAAFGLR